MSVFSTSIRAFFGTLFGMLGFLVSILIFALLFGLISGGKGERETPSKVAVIPDHTGHKEALHSSSPLILLVDIHGVIGVGELDIENIRAQIERAYAFSKGRIRGLLLTINSPGGGVTDSFAIYQLLKGYKEQFEIPIYAYVDGYCASGGLLIGCAADKIIASSVSIIGSVGARTTLWNFSDTLDKLGVKTKMLAQGIDKGNLDPFLPWKEGDTDGAVAIMEELYDLFLDAVVSSRPKLSRDKLVKEYGAQVFIAETAKKYGYIDGILPTRNNALLAFAQAIGIAGEGYQVVSLTAKSWVEELFKTQSPLFTGKVKHEVVIPPSAVAL